MECPSCGKSLIPDASKAKSARSAPSAPKAAPGLGRLLFAIFATAALTAAIGAFAVQAYLVDGRRVAVHPTETSEAPRAGRARTERALALPEGVVAGAARVSAERVYLLASAPDGQRRVIVFDPAGATVRQTRIPLAVDWEIVDFAPIGDIDVLVAGYQPDGVFLARIDGAGALDWARLEAAHSRAPGPIDVAVTDELVHALLPGPGARERTLAAYSSDGARLWRRSLPGPAADGHAALTVSTIGEPVALVPVDGGDGRRRRQLTVHGLSGEVEVQRLGPEAADYAVVGLAHTDLSDLVVLDRANAELSLRVRDASGRVRLEAVLPASLTEDSTSRLVVADGTLLLGPAAKERSWTLIRWDRTGRIERASIDLPPSIAASELLQGSDGAYVHAVSWADADSPHLWEVPLPARDAAPAEHRLADAAIPHQDEMTRTPDRDEAEIATVLQTEAAPESDAALTQPVASADAADSAEAGGPQSVPAPSNGGTEVTETGLNCTFVCAPDGVPAASYRIAHDLSIASTTTQSEFESLLADTHIDVCAASGGIAVYSTSPVCAE